MKPRIIFFLIILLLVGCTKEVIEDTAPVDKEDNMADEVVEITEPENQPIEQPDILEPVPTTENIVNITDDGFEPEDITINAGQKVQWEMDNKLRKIACYDNDNRRVFVSQNFEDKTETVSYTFDKRGKYVCIDAIFGLRMIVNVEE